MSEGFGSIRSTMGITGTSRPCLITTCGGQMQGWMYKYDTGKFRVIFRCARCHVEIMPGLGQARTVAAQSLNHKEVASD